VSSTKGKREKIWKGEKMRIGHEGNRKLHSYEIHRNRGYSNRCLAAFTLKKLTGLPETRTRNLLHKKRPRQGLFPSVQFIQFVQSKTRNGAIQKKTKVALLQTTDMIVSLTMCNIINKK